MPTPAEQPRFDQPVVDQRGLVTRAWQDYFLRMSSRSSQEDLAAIVAEIQRRVDELANGQAMNFRIFGQSSIIVNGVVQPDGIVVITLEGDEDAPGNTAYYGTGPTGQKGWFTVESAIEVATDELTKAVAGTGVVTLGLADLADTGVGAALVKITRDAKGRVSGTAAATTTDLAEGTNLYFTAARADARISIQKGQPNGLAPLGPDSLIPTAYLPPLALTDVSVVNSQAAQLALVAQEGDVAVRTDISKNYIHNGGTAGTMADWTELLTPAAPVQSVNGKTGTVLLVPGDIGAATAAQGAKADSALQPGAAHNTSLSGLQGGAAGEYYHATAAQNAALTALAISGYIDGFRMVWNSGTSVTFESGTAAIQSSGTLLRSPTAVTKSGLSLAASTVVHAYAYSNSGTPDIELSTTAPAAAYIGTARSKTGDPSRRYIGSLLTDATGAIFNFSNDGRSVFYLVNVAQAPFRVLNAGTSATWTLVSFAGALPPTVTNAIVNITAAGTAVSRVRPAGGTYVGNGRLYGLSPGALAFGPLPMNGGPQAEYIADAGGACSVDVLGYDFAR